MVQPRFAKLPQQQQQAILRSALDEFAAHGFRDASLNRVIEAAGISKGSMYYYFEGKADLYTYVARTESAELFAEIGPLPDLDRGGADEFWAALEGYYLRVMRALVAAPSKDPTFQRAMIEAEQAALPWIQQALATGQRVGAVRQDLPPTLLITVIVGMGEAMDLWLVSQQPDDDELPPLIAALVSMIRGAVGA